MQLKLNESPYHTTNKVHGPSLLLKGLQTTVTVGIGKNETETDKITNMQYNRGTTTAKAK